MKDVKDPTIHNRNVLVIAKIIALGIVIIIFGALEQFLDAISFLVAVIAIPVIFATSAVFIDKLPIWEER